MDAVFIERGVPVENRMATAVTWFGGAYTAIEIILREFKDLPAGEGVSVLKEIVDELDEVKESGVKLKAADPKPTILMPGQ